MLLAEVLDLTGDRLGPCRRTSLFPCLPVQGAIALAGVVDFTCLSWESGTYLVRGVRGTYF
jgi:hypothetical protein